jgi:hypothetical protein
MSEVSLAASDFHQVRIKKDELRNPGVGAIASR